MSYKAYMIIVIDSFVKAIHDITFLHTVLSFCCYRKSMILCHCQINYCTTMYLYCEYNSITILLFWVITIIIIMQSGGM